MTGVFPGLGPYTMVSTSSYPVRVNIRYKLEPDESAVPVRDDDVRYKLLPMQCPDCGAKRSIRKSDDDIKCECGSTMIPENPDEWFGGKTVSLPQAGTMRMRVNQLTGEEALDVSHDGGKTWQEISRRVLDLSPYATTTKGWYASATKGWYAGSDNTGGTSP